MPKKNEAVIVTGASRGLGRGIALKLAEKGYDVAINYAGNLDAAKETLRLCEEASLSKEQKFLPVQADISSATEREKMLSTVFAEFSNVTGLVNNAGIAPKIRADILDATEESFLDLVKTNLMGPYFLTQSIAQKWIKQNNESKKNIVFVTSISAHTASVNRGDYCVSKAGLSMAVQLFAARLASENINVYELRPGIMKTDMTAGVTDKYDKLIKDGLVPQLRWGSPEDLGNSVYALLANYFSFSTGTVIDVDGGFQIRRL